MESNKLASQSPCSDYADLLTQHSSHCYLEIIPATGSPQAGALSHQGCEHRIAGQMVVNRLDISSKIEETPHAGNDSG